MLLIKIEYFKKNKKPFMFNTEISDYDWYNGHSGASLAISLRSMEFIAKNGWDKFVAKNSK